MSIIIIQSYINIPGKKLNLWKKRKKKGNSAEIFNSKHHRLTAKE